MVNTMANKRGDQGPRPGPVTIYDKSGRPLVRVDTTTGVRVLLVSPFVIAGRKGGQRGGHRGGLARWKDVDTVARRAAMARAAERRWRRTSVEERQRYAAKMVEARRAADAAKAMVEKAPQMNRAEMKQARTDLDLTQKELAAKLGMHPVTVARWETGARGISEPIATLVRRLLSENQADAQPLEGGAAGGQGVVEPVSGRVP
jgi:DNA-binding transcriptional regulator YiaG